jgi:hypothetical protein
MWSAYAALGYAALHVVAAWLGVPLMLLVGASVERLRHYAGRWGSFNG